MSYLCPALAWRAAALDDERVFTRRQPGDPGELTVDILLDGSASQNQQQEKLAAQAYIIVESLALEPVTGRTHQLRLHCAYMGYPILGDPQYGTEESQAYSLARGIGTQLLCAKRIRFLHPITGAAMFLESEMDV